MTTMQHAEPRAEKPHAPGSPWLMLVMATLGFAVNFWAWALISPLGPLLREGTLGSLSESDVALLVAVPVIVGSLGRIVVGALTRQARRPGDVPDRVRVAAWVFDDEVRTASPQMGTVRGPALRPRSREGV